MHNPFFIFKYFINKNKVDIIKKENNMIIFKSHLKDLYPICKTNYKNLSSKKCKDCVSLEWEENSIKRLSTRLPKEVLKDFLKNKSKKKILEDFKMLSSFLLK